MANLEMEKLVLSGFDANTYTLTPDTTLAKSGVPADAKATGDAISTLNTDLSAIRNGHIELESGTFADADGVTETTNTARIRNVYPLNVDDVESIVIPSGYSAWFFRLDSTVTLISAVGTWKSGTQSISDIVTSNTKYLNFALRNNSTPSSDISANVDTVAESLYVVNTNNYLEYSKFVNDVDDLTAELSSEISDLNNQINDIAILSSNRLNLNTITPNKSISPDGTESASTSNSVTDFISVTAGETIYFWSKRSDGYYLFDVRFLTAYDSSKVAMSASGGSYVGGSYTVPNGIAYVRLTISNTYLSSYTDFYVGSLTLDEYSQYLPYGAVKSLINQPQVDTNTANITTNTADIALNTANIASVTKPSSNLLDLTAITPNVYIPNDGSINPVTDLSATDYLPVEEGDVIYGWGSTNGAYSAITFRFICAYASDKTPVSASGENSESTPPYTVPSGVSYLRITLKNEVLSSFSNLYIGTHNVGVDYEEYGVVLDLPASEDTTYSVTSGGSILEGVKYCYVNNIKNLIVEAGTYDIISEYESHYGATYFDDYIDYAQGDIFDAGIWLQNISVKFSAGAKVTCKYTGNNQNVIDYFSAFATGNNVILDGLVLDAENLRYGIHSDYNSGSDETYYIVRNCDIKNVRSDGNKCIGAGLGRHVYWLFENTIFRTTGSYYAMRIHNNVNSDAMSKIVVRDCYIDGDGWFVFNSYSTSTDQTIIQVCGNSYKVAPVVGRETSDSNDNFTMIAWNNELRA